MSLLNFRKREVNCKIVYYGPSLGGKTTNITGVYQKTPEANRGPLQCVDTQGDRTLFFDHFELSLGKVGDMTTRFQLYAVPGQPRYRSTRRMVLGGVDGVVFVADSDRGRLGDNVESLTDMRQLLTDSGYDYEKTPMVIQYNKRDLPDAHSIEELEHTLNERGCRSFEAVAIEGQGVIETFKAICAQVVTKLNDDIATAFRAPGLGGRP